jgi:hypothetical protein
MRDGADNLRITLSPAAVPHPAPFDQRPPSNPVPLHRALTPRAFRLHLSSKAGKEAHLRATPRFGGGARDPREFFFDSLISNTPFGPCREAWLERQQQGQQQPGQQQQQQQQQQQVQGQQGRQENWQQREFGREQQLDSPAGGPRSMQHGGSQSRAGSENVPGAHGAAWAPTVPPTKAIWLPAWRLQQASGALSQEAAAAALGLPSNAQLPLSCLPSPLARRHALPHAAARVHVPGRGVAAGGGGAPRPVSLLRCEGVDWEPLLALVPPEWRALAALHHAVTAAAGCGGAPGAPGRRGPAPRWGEGGGGISGAWQDAGDARVAPSPFPDVDAFIESVCTQVGGRAGTWQPPSVCNYPGPINMGSGAQG